MYGTIARLQVTPGKLDALKAIGARSQDEGIYPDIVFQHLYQSDAREQEVWLVVGFTSRAAYQTNAASPEQHERYQELRALLDADPEWHDGEVLHSFTR